MMKIRAVLVDMDGTLLGNSQVAVSVRNMTALQRALEQGVQVIPCTGRVYDMLPPQLLTQPGLRYFITSHGARAYDREENRSIYENLIPAEQAAQLMEILENKGLYNEIAADGTIYLEGSVAEALEAQPVPPHHVWYIADRCYTAVEKPSAYFREHEVAVEKMNLYGIPARLQQELYDAVTATGFVKHTRPGAGANLEFSHHSLNKLRAVDAILSKLGISYEETLAIGDSSSDIEILQTCGIGVAMGNAPDHIKAIADTVTDLNVEDGFAVALEKYVLREDAPRKPYLICIDSDGCALDTMEIKHKECFCPAFINAFDLQPVSKYAREAWEFFNLYSSCRGMNRFLTLLKSLDQLAQRPEVAERGFVPPVLSQLREYVAQGRPLNNDGLEEYLQQHPQCAELQRVLDWSLDVNRRVAELVRGVKAFPHVKESLEEMSQYADIVIVSATQTKALEREWEENGLLPLVKAVHGQESGSKKEVLAACKDGYAPENVIMVGDAPGDREAAEANGVAFYPICPEQEARSWAAFRENMQCFMAGAYAARQQENIAYFETLLPEHPTFA